MTHDDAVEVILIVSSNILMCGGADAPIFVRGAFKDMKLRWPDLDWEVVARKLEGPKVDGAKLAAWLRTIP